MNTLPNINKQTKHIRTAALLNAAKNTMNVVKDIPKGINFSLSAPQSLSKKPFKMSLEQPKLLSLIPPEYTNMPTISLPKISNNQNMILPPLPPRESFSSTNTLPLPPIKQLKLGGTKRKRSLRKTYRKKRTSIKRKHVNKKNKTIKQQNKIK